MKRALELAALGHGKVSPNPMVGCVIVKDDHIIGEGWHNAYGGPHAEVNAVQCVQDKTLLQGSDVYVTLEPCSHHGKTPPCADMLIEYGVGKVVVCNEDPNPLVSGRGIRKLRQAGIHVDTGILKAWGQIVNQRFFRFHQQKRPWVILKWAETADGLIARENNDARWISNTAARKLVHKWRSEEDAILVGSRTVHFDNPELNTRDWHGKSPVRITIDGKGSHSKDLKLYDQQFPTIVFNHQVTEQLNNLEYVKVGREHILQDIMNALYERNIQSVIVEGGAVVINSLVQAGLWDEARIFQAPKTFGKGVGAPRLRDAMLEMSTDVMGDRLLVMKRVEHGRKHHYS